MALNDDSDPSDSGRGGSSSKPKPAPKLPSEPGRVARNDTNNLQLKIVPLRIGHTTTAPDDVTRFRIWVPTDSGGVLTISPASGTVDLRKPIDNVIERAASKITHEVKAGEFGEFFAIYKGKAGTTVDCQFVQISFARDGKSDSDPPLIPWTFWYWPTAKDGDDWKKAGDVMAKYGNAFNKDANDCRNEELTKHVTASTADGGGAWEGHCHLAAPASIMFEEPKAVKHNGQSFDVKEMKYLALEYFGCFGQLIPVWELKRGSNKVGKYYVPGYFKPGEPKNRQKFIDALKTVYDPKLVDAVPDIADAFINSVGGEAKFEVLMNQWLGQLGAEFYRQLIAFMRVDKHPLMANMRGYYPYMEAVQVWNHCIFWYKATYQEKDDEKDMLIDCDLRVNLDVPVDSGQPPAKVSGGQVIPDDKNTSSYRCRWRIQFDDSGKIIVGDRNEWNWIQDDKKGELYTPTKLQAVDKPSKTHNSASNPLDVGNVFVDLEVVDAGMLKLRKRYT